jgi:hypothetical protein
MTIALDKIVWIKLNVSFPSAKAARPGDDATHGSQVSILHRVLREVRRRFLVPFANLGKFS